MRKLASSFGFTGVEERVSRMPKTVAVILLLCSLGFTGSAFPQSHHRFSSGTHSSHHSSKTKKSSGSKTVHVRGYTRKDGTYVAPYDRGAPGTTGQTISASSPSLTESTHSHSYRKNHMAEGITPDPTVRRDKHGRIKRSSSAKSAFERQSPCPSTGKTKGRCPGYIIDHINPLECGGADAPFNMQWQTIADAKAKDKTEGSCRQ